MERGRTPSDTEGFNQGLPSSLYLLIEDTLGQEHRVCVTREDLASDPRLWAGGFKVCASKDRRETVLDDRTETGRVPPREGCLPHTPRPVWTPEQIQALRADLKARAREDADAELAFWRAIKAVLPQIKATARAIQAGAPCEPQPWAAACPPVPRPNGCANIAARVGGSSDGWHSVGGPIPIPASQAPRVSYAMRSLQIPVWGTGPEWGSTEAIWIKGEPHRVWDAPRPTVEAVLLIAWARGETLRACPSCGRVLPPSLGAVEEWPWLPAFRWPEGVEECEGCIQARRGHSHMFRCRGAL